MFMRRKLQQCLLAVAVLCGVTSAQAFSLLGPIGAHPWQTPAIGYDWGGFDIGNPMNLGEEYRWTTPVITYAFDSSFLNYFGQQGVEAVEEAIQVFNDLPRASDINLDDYPTENRRLNDLAAALGIQDVKSTVMTTLLELMGLAEAERWVWALRSRTTRTVGGVTITNYLVVQRNFDPVTFEPTNRVNDVLYNYVVTEFEDPDFADALETFDPLAFPFSSVTSGRGGSPGYFGLLPGQLYAGLTRDDVGGLRYLLRRNNYNVEQLITNTFLAPGFVPTPVGGAGGGTVPWLPAVIGTNQVAPTLPPGTTPFTPWIGLTNITTNVFGTNITNILAIDVALRPGVEKITFRRVNFDSLLGQAFPPFTNTYNDTVISNFSRVTQRVQRVLTQPDLVFGVADLGLTTDNPPSPVGLNRGVVMVNNDAINGITVQGGPGVLRPPLQIVLTDQFPVFFDTANFPDGPDVIDPTDPFARFLILGIRSIIWGSFDATAAPPIVYPNSISLEELEALVERR